MNIRFYNYIAVAALFFSAYATPASAIYFTGRDLVTQCDSDNDKRVASCLGYIAGVIDYHVMQQSLGTAPTTNFCLPADLSAAQAATQVISYLKKNPYNLDFIAGPGIAMALSAEYPCAAPAGKKKKKR